jgi:transposase
MTEHKVFKFKLVPTAQQINKLEQFGGARRFVYNWGLNRCREYYKETGQGISWKQPSQEFTALKSQPGFEWLREMDSQAHQQALADLKRAFVNFFHRRARNPRYNRRKATRQSFRHSDCQTSGRGRCAGGRDGMARHMALRQPARLRQGRWHRFDGVEPQVPN